MGRPSKYSQELRERAVRLVFDRASDYSSHWRQFGSVAEKIGGPVEVLRRWVRQAERDAGTRASLCIRHHAAFRRGNFQSGRAKWQV